MPDSRHMGTVLDDAFAAVASPRRLDAGKVRLVAWLTINAAAARAGKPQPGGDVLIAVGTERDCDTAIAFAKGTAAGGPFVAEYSPALDGVRVSPIAEVESRARQCLARGIPDAEEWYPVAVGDLRMCETEATRFRRVRAGVRSREVPAT